MFDQWLLPGRRARARSASRPDAVGPAFIGVIKPEHRRTRSTGRAPQVIADQAASSLMSSGQLGATAFTGSSLGLQPFLTNVSGGWEGKASQYPSSPSSYPTLYFQGPCEAINDKSSV